MSAGCKEFTAGAPLSTRFGWFASEDSLIVVGRRGETQKTIDLGLAYGLGHLSDKKLVLILPEGSSEPSRRRVAFLDVDVDLYEHDGKQIQRMVPLSRHEIQTAYSDALVTHTHRLGDNAMCVERLLKWAGECPELVAAHRLSYLAWHCRGRLVLKIRATSTKVVVTAGVHSAASMNSWNFSPTEQMPTIDFHAVVTSVSKAIVDRLSGVDDSHGEHALQELLARHKQRLGLTSVVREMPATRPVDDRGFIDLLGVNDKNEIHIVETKIGADPMLVLQGLDYWIWAEAHQKDLIDYLNTHTDAKLSASAKIHIDFVVAAKDGKNLSPYTVSQLESLDGGISWRWHDVELAGSEEFNIRSLRRRQVPSGDRFAPPAFRYRAERHTAAPITAPLALGILFKNHSDGVIEPAMASFNDLKQRKLLHRFFHHVRSSQRFAVNVFGGLTEIEQKKIWALLNIDAKTLGGVELEYTDAEDALNEVTSTHPHSTQVDVLLRCVTHAGQRHVALIEVKLAETGFGTCSAFESAHNTRRDVCRSDGAWGGDPQNCFQLHTNDPTNRRLYDKFLSTSEVNKTSLGCPFRVLNQPMRNIALSQAMLNRSEVDEVTFALVAPKHNRMVWRQWDSVQSTFGNVSGVSLVGICSEEVIECLSDERQRMLEGHYEDPIVPGSSH